MIIRKTTIVGVSVSGQKLGFDRFRWGGAIRSIAAILCICCISTLAGAQSDKQPQRGFSAAGTFNVNEIDSINTSNGNVMFNIPIASLPINQGGSPGATLSLQYNSKIFDPTAVRIVNDPTALCCTTRTFLIESPNGNWRYTTSYNLEVIDRRADYHYPNGGTPQEECADSMYASDVIKVRMRFPDGSTTDFRPTGVANDDTSHRSFFNTDPEGRSFFCQCLATGCGPHSWAINSSAPTYATKTYFSGDGTYQKLVISFGPPDGSGFRPRYWTLYRPDGTRVSTDPSIAVNGGQRILDRNNNYTDYLSTTKNGNPATRIVDQVGRDIVIEYASSYQDFVYVKGTGGVELKWTIQWTTTFVNKTYYAQTSHNPGDTTSPVNMNASFKVLQSITLPSQAGNLSYNFEYNGAASSDYPNGGTVNPSIGWGEVSKVTLPSGAKVSYKYKRDNQSTIGSWEVLQNHPVRKELEYLIENDGDSTSTTESATYEYQFNHATGSAHFSKVVTPDGGVSSETFSMVDGFTYGRSILSTRPDGTTIERIWLANRVPPQGGLTHDMNAYIKTEFASITGGKTAIKDYSYDKNGNLTKIKEYDWLNQSTIHGGPGGTLAIPASAQPTRVTVNTYYSPTPEASDATTDDPDSYYNGGSPRLRNALHWTEVRSGSEQTLARTEYMYDDALTTGNRTEQRTWDSTKGSLPQEQPTLLNSSNAIIVTAEYTPYGMPRLLTDANGNRTQFTYGQIGTVSDLYATQIENAWDTQVERTETRQYDFNTGLLTVVVDEDNDVSTVTSYDVFGRPTLVRAAAGLTETESQTSTQYFDSERRIVVRSDLDAPGDGKITTIQHFDQLGRIRLARQLEEFSTSALTDETVGIKVQTRYAISNPCQPLNDVNCLANNSSVLGSYIVTSTPYRATISAHAGSESTMGWTRSRSDKTRRVVETSSFTGSALPAPWFTNTTSTGTVATAYDGIYATVTDQAGKVRRSKVDGLGRLIRVDEPSDAANTLGGKDAPTQATNYQYNALDNLTQITQGSQTRYFSYSSLGRLTSASNPESGVINYEYDENGNLKKKIDPRLVPDTSIQRTTTYEYDALGRVISRVYNDGTPNVSYGYDAVAFSKGRLTSVSSTVSSYSYDSFDPLGRVKTSKQTTDGQAYAMSYSYNRAGALTSQTYPSGRVVNTEYDGAGRIAGIKKNGSSSYYAGAAPADSSNRLQYSAHGAVQAMKLGNGLWEHANFNSRLQLTQIGLGTASTNSSELKLDYDYGTTANNGNLLTQTITLPDLTLPAPHTRTLTQTYTYDELNRLATAKENNGESWKQKFLYDRYGNRRIDSNPADTSELLVGPNPVFSTANNRIVAQTGEQYEYDNAGNLTRDRDGQTYVFDAKNKMVSFNGGASQGGADYRYDGAGQRVKKVVGTVTTIFVYDAFGKLIAEYSSAAPQLNGTRYLTSDHLGSPRVVTSSNGLVQARHDYHPFGEEVGLNEQGLLRGGRTVPNGYVADALRQRFTTKERDFETQLDYFYSRYYSAVQGRFTSADSIGGRQINPQTLNLFSYVRNNPLRYIDPTGHFLQDPQQDRSPLVDPKSLEQLGPPPPPFTYMRVTVTITEISIYDGMQEPGMYQINQPAVSAGIFGFLKRLTLFVKTMDDANKRYERVVNSPEGQMTMLVFSTPTFGTQNIGRTTAAMQGDADAMIEMQLFRNGAFTETNFTPRPGRDANGLSTFTTLERATPPGGKAQVINPSLLKNLKPELIDPGHYGIVPKDPSRMAGWMSTRGTGVVHEFTIELMNAVTNEIKRPKQ